MSIDALKKRIKEGNLTGVYAFFGEEEYLKEYYYRQLMDKVVDGPMKDFNLTVFDGKGMDLEQVRDALELLPVMAQQKMIVIKDSGVLKAPKAEEKEFWDRYLDDLPPYVCLVFYEKEVDKRSKIFGKIKKIGLPVEFGYQKDAYVASWVGQKLASHNKRMDKKDIYYLIEHCDTGMMSLKNEIEKLIYYCGSREVISRQDIDAVCVKSIESRVFNMIDAFTDGNTGLVFEYLDDMKKLKEPVVKIIALLSRHFSGILKVKVLLEEGAHENEIASKLKIASFVVKKYIKYAQRFSVNYLRSVLEGCLEIDNGIKSGKMNDWVALQTFIAKYSKKD
ncbi:MAG: DNA polymerase III subunit delta [Clostridiaceae bacterium]|nr:DNA polymerase III subunit delta [Clostridiaceae bacterium]